MSLLGLQGVSKSYGAGAAEVRAIQARVTWAFVRRLL